MGPAAFKKSPMEVNVGYHRLRLGKILFYWLHQGNLSFFEAISLFRTLQGTVEEDWKTCISFADSTAFGASLAEWFLKVALNSPSESSLTIET